MRTAKQQERRERIEDAAYAVLRQAGYKSTSLLAVARQASASNETLYNWYGNKQGLFRSLVETNAGQAKALLEEAMRETDDPLATLAKLGPVLLGVVTGEKAVTLNRAAAGDVSDTGTLGPAISRFGRETIAPLLCQLLDAARRAGQIDCDDPSEAAGVYISLLIGDLQIRRVIGVLSEPTPSEIRQRSHQAMALFFKLYAARR